MVRLTLVCEALLELLYFFFFFSDHLYMVLSALVLLLCASAASANFCRTGSLSCGGDRDCWQDNSNKAGKNSSSSSFAQHNCKCCKGYPFHPQGECRR